MNRDCSVCPMEAALARVKRISGLQTLDTSGALWRVYVPSVGLKPTHLKGRFEGGEVTLGQF